MRSSLPSNDDVFQSQGNDNILAHVLFCLVKSRRSERPLCLVTAHIYCLGYLHAMMRLASLTTMLTAPIVRVASLRKCSLQEREMDMCKSSYKIILGSSSMARRQILAEMGYEFSIMTADIDEKSIRKEKPEELVMALAHAKADAIITRLQSLGHLEENARATLLITADTVVLYKGMIREKPTSKEEAWNFIKGWLIVFFSSTAVDKTPTGSVVIWLLFAGYSGGHAAVIGSVLVSNLTTGTRKGAWETAEVYFHEIPDEVIDSLIEEEVTFKVAGGLMLEHPLTSPFVEAVVGSTDTVMGLSTSLTEKLIAEAL
ncbi:7-methyl-GTP pyrophosphatase isoform X1 [Manihot esculenta]|uniref:7-methyl-GTP pyrophosphatase isoform X1 n=1 Tax=Manihot esculenta TaxID=3983 RepID=UPI000B5D516B|nr:7-methyl-GTP pyrophosphatase isoform X1 [Manihot esculenta]